MAFLFLRLQLLSCIRVDQFRHSIKYSNMKSKIMIDFGHDYKPVIKITRESSDDVRDRLISAFLDELGTETSCLFIANHTPANNTNKQYAITTMPPEKRFQQFGEEILSAVNDGGANAKKVMDFFAWFEQEAGIRPRKG